MFCKNCGKELSDGARFCEFCGEKIIEEKKEEKPENGTPDILNSGLFKQVQNDGAQQNAFAPSSPASESGLFSSGLVSAVGNGVAQESQNPFGAAKQNDVSNPFGTNTSSANVQSNPFGAQSQSPAANQNPFGASASSSAAVNSNPFASSPASAPSASGNELWNPDKDVKKEKKAKKEKEKKEKKAKPAKQEKAPKKSKSTSEKESKQSGAQTAKIAIMIALQFLFVGIIAFLAMSGKLNDQNGDINLGLTIGAFVVILAADAVIYFILFANSLGKSELAPPPVFPTHENMGAPAYMNASRNSSSEFAMGNVSKTDRDRLLDNEDRFGAKNAAPSGSAPANAFAGIPVQNTSVQTPVKEPVRESYVQNNAFAQNFASQSAPVNEAPVVTNPEPQPVGAVVNNDVQDDCELTQLLNVPVYDYADETTIINYAKLFFTENGVTKQVNITRAEFVIGRMASKVDCVVTNRNVGRIHAAIITRDGNFYLKDFNSKNKTYINRGTPLTPEREYLLHNNDVISLADSEFVFRLPD